MIWLKEICEGGEATPPANLGDVFSRWQFEQFEGSVRSNPKKLSELKSSIEQEEELFSAVIAAELGSFVERADRTSLQGGSEGSSQHEWLLQEGKSSFKIRVVAWPTDSLVASCTENDILLVTGLPPNRLEQWLGKRKTDGLVIAVTGRSLYVCTPQGENQTGSTAGATVLIRNQVYARLRDHLIERGYAVLDRASSTETILQNQQSVGSVFRLLLRNEFRLTAFKETILATHSTGKVIFVRLSLRRDDLSKLPDVRGLILDRREFEKVLGRLLDIWNQTHEIDTSRFNQDILTDLGWHSYSGVLERQATLEAAVALYGVDHVTRLLTWLSNAWRHHPTNHVYVDALNKDLGWVYQSYASSGQYLMRFEGSASSLGW